MTTSPPPGDHADSDEANSDVAACDCPLDTEDCTDPTHAAANLGATGSSLGVGETAWSDPASSPVADVRSWVAAYRTSAYQRGMQLAHGHDVPPLPVPALPSRVDDLDSDTYDALRSRYAWLEQRHRDTAHSELAAVNVRQAVEIGELREALGRNRSADEPAAQRTCVDHRHRVPACEVIGCRSCVDRPDPSQLTTHSTSCAAETGFKICYCECGDCNGPDGRCICEFCDGWHDKDQDGPVEERTPRYPIPRTPNPPAPATTSDDTTETT